MKEASNEHFQCKNPKSQDSEKREHLSDELEGEFIQIKNVLVLAYLDRDQFIVQLRQFLFYQQKFCTDRALVYSNFWTIS